MINFGKLKAVLWDMDGVLLDSQSAHFISFKEVMAKHNYEVTVEKFKPCFGMTNKQVIHQLSGDTFTSEEVQAISLEKDVLFRKVIAVQATFLPKVEHWLAEFKEAGILQALASSGTWDNIYTILDALHARSYFDAIVSGEDCASKPAPAIFLRAAGQLKVKPAGCLVIEDSIAGVKAAAAAGMKCLAVATTHPIDKLPHADLKLPDLTSLTVDMLAGIFKD
jgi:beta-phosphoglucomutase